MEKDAWGWIRHEEISGRSQEEKEAKPRWTGWRRGNNDTPSKKQKRIQKYEKAVAKAAEAKAETMVAAAVSSYESEEQGDAKFDASLVSAIERMTNGASSSPKPDNRKAKLASIAMICPGDSICE